MINLILFESRKTLEMSERMILPILCKIKTLPITNLYRFLRKHCIILIKILFTLKIIHYLDFHFHFRLISLPMMREDRLY